MPSPWLKIPPVPNRDPGAPAGPWGPVAPVAPVAPAAPCGPAGPWAPDTVWGPSVFWVVVSVVDWLLLSPVALEPEGPPEAVPGVAAARVRAPESKPVETEPSLEQAASAMQQAPASRILEDFMKPSS